MPEMNLKKKERIKKFKVTGDSWFIYQIELDKVCFQDDIAYGDLKKISKTTASAKILHHKAFDIDNL